MAADQREDAQVRWVTLALSTLATIAVEQGVLEPGRSRVVALASTLGLLVCPAMAAAWCFARQDRRADASNRPPRGQYLGHNLPLTILLLVFALPVAGNAGQWLTTGRWGMPEVTLLACLRNLGLGLAALAHRRTYARLCALVSLFLVSVASPIGGEAGPAVMVPVAGFALAGVLWLLLVYWKRFGLATGQAALRFPISGLAWVAGVIAVAVAVAAVGPSRPAKLLAGLVPTSGGTDWSDPDARSGVGDGDNEVSASENPQSVGFTESEVYLETDRPSLYDAFSETYGEPFKPKKVEKMVALGQQDVGDQKERAAENLQAGREFAAVRRKPEPRARRPGERAAKALVYVKGPTPLHMPLTAFDRFDGVTWREEPVCDRDFPASLQTRTAWFRMPVRPLPYLAGMVFHQVKVGMLDSSPLPAPAHLQRFRVGSISRRDFFAWAQAGIVRMTDRTVPAGTVIDTEAHTVDPERLRSLVFDGRAKCDANRHLAFCDGYRIDPAVQALAEAWTRGKRRGWDQVEAAVDALRQGCVHDRTYTAPADCADVVAEFLLRSRRGPDYLFASSAAVLLRSLGYPTRVVSGLYAAPGRYDRRTRHTPVTGEDLHFWAEVRTPDGLWVAVEPTPGYELLPPRVPWTEVLARAFWSACRWAWGHAGALLAGAVIVLVLLVRRYEILDALATLEFLLRIPRDPRHCVLRALRLVEHRACWAGGRRPLGLTIARWYRPLARQAEEESRAALERFVRLADWAVHAPQQPGHPLPLELHEIERACRAATRVWTLARLRATFSLRPRKAATT